MDVLNMPPQNECLGCGRHVTKSFARTYGDENDRVHRCPSCCESLSRLKRGSGTGREPNPRGAVLR